MPLFSLVGCSQFKLKWSLSLSLLLLKMTNKAEDVMSNDMAISILNL